MKSLDELTHLMNFLEIQLAEDNGIMSQETIDELKYVLETYSNFEDNTDLASILKKMEVIDDENQTLKTKLEKANAELKEKTESSEKYRKTVIANQTELNHVNSATEDKIIQLTDDVHVLTSDKNVLLKELEDERSKFHKTELALKECEEKCRVLEANLTETTEKYEKLSSLNNEDDKILKDRLEQKEKEFDTLKKTYSKLSKQGEKISRQINLLKADKKNNDNIIKRLERENKELKDIQGKVQENVENSQKKDQELITKLVIEIQTTDYNKERLADLLETFGKKQILIKASPMVREISMVKIDPVNNYGNLQDYEDVFNNSHALGPDNQNNSYHDIQMSFENKEDMPVFESNRNIHFIESMQKQGMADLYNSDVLTDMTVKKEADPRKFLTTKEDVRKQLEDMIGERTLFKTRGPERLEINGASMVFEDKEEVIKDLKGTRSIVDLSSKIKQEELEKLIEYLEDYLNNDKNPTTFTLTNYDKRQMMAKFTKTEDRNLRKFFIVVIKLFVYQINFLEGHIKNLTNSNSHLHIKVDNMKTDMARLLKTYLEKNKKTQDFLNTNSEFKKSKLGKNQPNESVVINGEQVGHGGNNSKIKIKDFSPNKKLNQSTEVNRSEDRSEKKGDKTSDKKKRKNTIDKPKGPEDKDENENLWSKISSFIPFTN